MRAVAPTATPVEPVPDADPRWAQLARLIEARDPARVIKGWAIFEGAFTQDTGEVGPTGKLRGWRIHQFRAKQLRPRATATNQIGSGFSKPDTPSIATL